MSQVNILLSYYGATLLFLLLDVVLGISIRISFLDANNTVRMLYYGLCMLCFLLMVWKPALTVVVGTVESLLTLVALILVMALRVMVPTDQMIETGAGLVTMPQIVNFILAGSMAYMAWTGGMKELLGREQF